MNIVQDEAQNPRISKVKRRKLDLEEIWMLAEMSKNKENYRNTSKFKILIHEKEKKDMWKM